MIGIRTKVNSRSVSISLKAAERAIERAALDGGLRAAQRLRDTIRDHATRRPGPEVVTGDYWRSWKIRRVGSTVAGVTSWSVYSEDPAVLPLEFGRVGAPPFPHIFVSIDEARDGIIADFGSGFRKLL